MRKWAKGWQYINEITARKSTKKGIIKSNNNEERKNKWYTYFKDLLSSTTPRK